jgi:hypothetical protein
MVFIVNPIQGVVNRSGGPHADHASGSARSVRPLIPQCFEHVSGSCISNKRDAAAEKASVSSV